MTTCTKPKAKAKLTDTQLVVLSAAARRESQALMPFPKSLKAKGPALTKAIKRLLQAGMAEERPVKATDPVWRNDDGDIALGLFITETGLAALDGPPPGEPADVRGKPGANTETAKKRASKPPRKKVLGTKGSMSKQDTVLALLKLRNGATIDDICSKTGWKAHSARGFLSGTVRKKLGLDLHSEKDGKGVRRYRIEQAARI